MSEKNRKEVDKQVVICDGRLFTSLVFYIFPCYVLTVVASLAARPLEQGF